MEQRDAFIKYNCLKSFSQIFDSKGEIAPIAEKSYRNLELKKKNKVNREQRIHYFAVGHTFKQLDTENLFEVELDEKLRKKKPNSFLSLQHFDVAFCDELFGTITNIRNINSHYVHSFEKIKVGEISSGMVSFIKESFELALIQIYLKEVNDKRGKGKPEIVYQDFKDDKDKDSKLVNYLFEKFYPFDNKNTSPTGEEKKRMDEYENVRNYFNTLTKDDAIDALLFVNVETDYEWRLFDTLPVFTITTGKYLSFHASLFLLSLFLYKNEANQLISKVKGFKKQRVQAERSKRELFTFFSKKFNSQDINSEENNLVKFRDIIQYLNHYPVEWNKDMELESKHQLMTDKLKEKIIEMEIDRVFPNYNGNVRFRDYTKFKLWKDRTIQNTYTEIEKTEFDYEIKTSPKLKDAEKKLSILEKKYRKTRSFSDEKAFNAQKKKVKEIKEENEPNQILEKLKKRIDKNLLFVSYGRNHDRFMDFAARFMAETNYFGKDAQFKMYCNYSPDVQNHDLLLMKESLLTKEYDRLKFHHGKLIHFTTFRDHLEHYESWDTPFVIENNAIQVKLTLASGLEKVVSIQRGLMIYLLEHVLFRTKPEDIENAGKLLIREYFFHQKKDLLKGIDVLEHNNSITARQKAELKKIIPKRLLNHFSPAVLSHKSEKGTLVEILEKTQVKEERYNKLLEKARQEGNLEDFIKRNKGKQFKLQFIRKAWHLMYFRESYMNQTKTNGQHHKGFHITRDEFNDFSRYLFAFDQVPSYKIYLKEMLDKEHFFENKEFMALFENGQSLDDFYFKTKQNYSEWLKNNSKPEPESDKYTLKRYEHLLADKMFYINTSHFVGYLKNHLNWEVNEYNVLKFESLKNNNKYLIDEYYYTDKLEKEEYKTCRKLFNELKTTRLEDTLLYEMAMRYLRLEKDIADFAREKVSTMMQNEVKFKIKDVKNFLYYLVVPFKKVDNYVSLMKRKDEQEQGKFKSSYLANLKDYLDIVKGHRDIRQIYSTFSTASKMSFDELSKIDGHLVTNSIRFTKLVMGLEKYYIVKNLIKIEKENRIVYSEIKDLKKYFDEGTRHKAFHFGVPKKSYENLISEIEKKYLQNEVKPTNPVSYAAIEKNAKSLCNIFLDTIHNDFFGKEKDGKKKKKDAEEKYYNQVVKVI